MPAKTSEGEFRGTAKRASSKRLKFLDSPPAFAGDSNTGRGDIDVYALGVGLRF
jgi:hypothetical protein